MPTALRSLCPCGGIKTAGTCDRCGSAPPKRKSRHERGYGNDWDKVTTANKMLIPVCIKCWHEDRIRVGGKKSGAGGSSSLHSHHIVKVRDAPQLRLDPDNLLTVCPDCHVALDTLYESDRPAYNRLADELKRTRDNLKS